MVNLRRKGYCFEPTLVSRGDAQIISYLSRNDCHPVAEFQFVANILREQETLPLRGSLMLDDLFANTGSRSALMVALLLAKQGPLSRPTLLLRYDTNRSPAVRR